MYRYLFKHTIRSLQKQKRTTLINISGLVLAICTVLFISAWIFQERSYDKHHAKAKRIYRFTVEAGNKDDHSYWHFARTWQKWRREIPAQFPEIETMAELAPCPKTVFRIKENSFYESGFAVVPDVFNVFDFEFIHGQKESVLAEKHTIVISEKLAEKYFSGENPVGNTIDLSGSYINSDVPYTISGVFKDVPITSHFNPDFLVRYHEPTEENQNEWAFTYFLIKEDADIENIRAQLPEFIKAHVPEGQQEKLIGLHFTPLTDIHLKSHIQREIQLNGDIKHVKLFLFVALGVFVIALINFLNLSTVAFGKRQQVFQIQRCIGGTQKHNVLQLLIESGVVAILATLISFLIFWPLSLLLSHKNVISAIVLNKSVFLNFLPLGIFIILIICLTGVLPYFLLRQRNSRGSDKTSANSLTTKTVEYYNKPFLVIQFIISVVVIIGSLMLSKQNNFMFSQNLGHDDKQIVMLNRNFWSEEDKLLLFEEELSRNPLVDQHFSMMEEPSSLVKDARQVKSSFIPGGFTDYTLTIVPSGHGLFPFFDIPLVAGRTMNPYKEGQKYEEYILNESAVRKLGYKSPEEIIGIDFTVKPFFDGIIHGGKVVGVVKDFNFSSLYHPIEPTVFFQKPIWQWQILVKFVPGELSSQLSSLQENWNAVFPDFPFDYIMLNDIYAQAYQKDIAVNKLLMLFSILCILISAVGLMGITSVLLIKRTKEIGIRKVNGAKIIEILAMLNEEFARWIIIAIALACPIAYIIVNKWLESFAYRTSFSWWVFALAGVSALVIAFTTVSWQSWRTARRNPVEALRYE